MSAPGWLGVLGFLAATGEPGDYERASADVQGVFSDAPVVVWERPLPAPPPSSSLRSETGVPVVRGDLIYLGASQDNALLVVDRRNGELLQRFPASGPVQSAPLLGDDLVWFADTGGTTWCYGLSDGLERWHHYSGAPLMATPTLADGQIFVANVDNLVFALDALSGELRWRHAQRQDAARASELQLFGAPSPTAAGDLVLTGHSDGTLVALGAKDGEVRWQQRVGEGRFPDLLAAPTVVGDAVLVAGYSGPLVALDLSTRGVRWRQDFGGPYAPLVVDHRLYLGGGDGKLRAVDVVTGEVLWTWDSDTQGALTAPVATEAGLLVGSAAGGLYLLDRATGALQWRLDVGVLLSGVSASPAVDGPEAVVVSNAGNLFRLRVPRVPAKASAEGVPDVGRSGAKRAAP